MTNWSIEQIITNKYLHNEFIQKMLKLIQDGIRYSKKISLSECEAYRNYLYYWNCLVVPNHDELKLKLLKHVYNLPVASHPGQRKILKLLQQEYHWPNMHKMIWKYITSCYTCQQAKALHKTYNSLLKPLPVPDQR